MYHLAFGEVVVSSKHSFYYYKTIIYLKSLFFQLSTTALWLPADPPLQQLPHHHLTCPVICISYVFFYSEIVCLFVTDIPWNPVAESYFFFTKFLFQPVIIYIFYIAYIRSLLRSLQIFNTMALFSSFSHY